MDLLSMSCAQFHFNCLLMPLVGLLCALTVGCLCPLLKLLALLIVSLDGFDCLFNLGRLLLLDCLCMPFLGLILLSFDFFGVLLSVRSLDLLLRLQPLLHFSPLLCLHLHCCLVPVLGLQLLLRFGNSLACLLSLFLVLRKDCLPM